MGTVEISTPSLHKVVGPLAKLYHRFESRHPAKQIYVEVFKSSGDHQSSAQNIGVFFAFVSFKTAKIYFFICEWDRFCFDISENFLYVSGNLKVPTINGCYITNVVYRYRFCWISLY